MPTKTTKSKSTKRKASSAVSAPSGKSWLLPGNRSVSSITIAAFAVLFVAVGGYLLYNASRATTQPELKSGYGGSIANDTPGSDCLDDTGNGGAGTQLSVDGCNGEPEQYYTFNSSGEIAVGKGCLTEQGASSTAGYSTPANVVIGPCLTSTKTLPWGVAWTKAGAQFHNNHDGSTWCLTFDTARGDVVDIRSCEAVTNQSQLNQRWFPDTYTAGQVANERFSGYVVDTAQNYWITGADIHVPVITCKQSGQAAFWIGLATKLNNTAALVEQDGAVVLCSGANAAPVYEAFYAIEPSQQAIYVPDSQFDVRGGDVLSAVVENSSTSFYMTLKNDRTGQSQSKLLTSSCAPGCLQNVDFMAEQSAGVMPFWSGGQEFTGAYTAAGTNQAEHPITAFGYTPLTMENSAFNTRVYPGSISSTSTTSSFSNYRTSN